MALAMRNLRDSPRTLAAAAATLDARADRANAQHAPLIDLRRMLLLGPIDAAAFALACLSTLAFPPPLLTVAERAAAEIAMRTPDTAQARASLARAREVAERARVPVLIAKVAEA